jgi:hypothetical protein
VSRPGNVTQKRRNPRTKPVRVVELLELARNVRQVRLVPDQDPVEQLTAARTAVRARVALPVMREWMVRLEY